jgi:hypothetical protein
VRHKLDADRLVFIDETWTKTNMTRTHGRSLRGTRLVAKVPHGHWRTLTFIAALRRDRITAPCVFDGPINGVCFRAYVEQVLVPTLKPGDIVIMDNPAATKPRRSAGSSAQPARPRSSCRPIRPTSTRSSKPSPSSSLTCASRKRVPSTQSRTPSVGSSIASRPPNAPTTTSQTRDMLPPKPNPL